MTSQQQNEAIAKWMGLHVSHCENGVLMHHLGGDAFDPVPDFVNDLNAMHEAIAKLSREQYDADDGFTYHLARVVTQDPEWQGWNFYELQEATAAQRAESLLKCLNLWTD